MNRIRKDSIFSPPSRTPGRHGNGAPGFHTGAPIPLAVVMTLMLSVLLLPAGPAMTATAADGLPDTIAQIKPSIVGVGTYLKTRRPPGRLMGTGFVVADGCHVITNAHVLPKKLDKKHHEAISVFTVTDIGDKVLTAEIVGLNKAHDLCLLRFEGRSIAPLAIGEDARVREGELYAFTGYPLGGVLGLNASTHRGIISAITPIVIPVHAIRQLDGHLINRLNQPYLIFQLDATAYPGNSGSPLYDVNNGRVVGIINKVFVKGTKEHAVTHPSGITYAIPSRYIKMFLEDFFPEEYGAGKNTQTGEKSN